MSRERTDPVPSVTHCPYCGSSDIYMCHRVPRCGACRSVFFVRFSRRLRRTQRRGSETTRTPAPPCARCEQAVAALSGMLQSYDILTDESPLSSNALALGVVRGAFIGAIDAARRLVTASAPTLPVEHHTGDEL